MVGVERWSLLALLSWAALIFAFSSVPGRAMPDIGSTDWLFHAGEYLVLGALAANHLVVRGWSGFKAAAAGWAGCVLYGAGDEAHQLLVPGRCASASDLAADAAGAFLGVVLVVLAIRVTGRGARG